MPISISDHSIVEKFIREKNDLQIESLKNEIISELEELKLRREVKIPVQITKKEAELLIELLVKIEAYQQGKGWLFRAKRRTSLIMEYL